VKQIPALEMLDEEHKRLPQPPTDHNVYSLGSIGGHNVVIAGFYQQGNNPTAMVVTQMRITFPNPQIRSFDWYGRRSARPIMGMIWLGDVVVSKPAGGHLGS